MKKKSLQSMLLTFSVIFILMPAAAYAKTSVNTQDNITPHLIIAILIITFGSVAALSILHVKRKKR